MTASKKNTLHLKREEDNGVERLSRSSEREVNTINDSEPKTTKSNVIIGPDGKEYIKREVKEINNRSARLNFPTREGYHRVAAVDRGPNDLQDMIDRGYSFVEGESKRYGGTRPDGSAYFHYLMEIPEKQYLDSQQKMMNKIALQEQQILNNSPEGTNIPRGYENRVSNSTLSSNAPSEQDLKLKALEDKIKRLEANI